MVETQTHLKVSKTEAKSVRSDSHGKRGSDGKAQNSPQNGKESRADLRQELVEISFCIIMSVHKFGTSLFCFSFCLYSLECFESPFACCGLL